MMNQRASAVASVLMLIAAVLALLGVGVGSTGFDSVLRAMDDPVALQILWDIRLPRTLGAWVAGALLGLAGAVAQGLFRNPLADPYLLGSASGASLGVALSLVLFGVSPFATQWLTRLGLTAGAFAGAVAGVLLTLMLAKGVQHTLRLLLAGVIVGVVLGAAKELIMLGTWLLCMAVAWALSPVLDGLALGEATAASLGLPLARLRRGLVAVLALATGTAVAQTGLVAFVGLAAPHLVRSVVKTSHGRLILLSSLMGGALLMAADILARWVIAPQELPVGVLTAVLGGGYLLWLMHQRVTARGVL